MVCSLYMADDFMLGCWTSQDVGLVRSLALMNCPSYLTGVACISSHPIQGQRCGVVERESVCSYYRKRRLKTLRVTFLHYTKSLFLAVNIKRFTSRVVRLFENMWQEQNRLQITWDPGQLGSENQKVSVQLARFSMRTSDVVFDSMFTLVAEQANTGEGQFIVPKGKGQGWDI